jgi:hypothetical protein
MYYITYLYSLKFNNIFALLRFRDKLKSNIRKKRYYLIDNYLLSNLTDIIMSYHYKLYNITRKYCLI